MRLGGHAQGQRFLLSSACTQLRHARPNEGTLQLKQHHTCLQGLLGVIKAQHADDADTNGSIAAACHLQQRLQSSAQAISGQQVSGGKLAKYAEGPTARRSACVLLHASCAAQAGTARSLDSAEGRLALQALSPWEMQLGPQLSPQHALMAAETTFSLPVKRWQVIEASPTCASCLSSLLVSWALKRPSKGTTTSWLRPKPLGCWAAAERHSIRCWPKQTHHKSAADVYGTRRCQLAAACSTAAARCMFKSNAGK